jgi:hypothetical protein
MADMDWQQLLTHHAGSGSQADMLRLSAGISSEPLLS